MIRITGGEFRGRSLKTPHGEKTRPSQSRLRQALLNSLQLDVPGAHVLDLFAGSGALGFEALSRGAESVVFVEMAKPVVKIIQENIGELKVGARAKVVPDDVNLFLKHPGRYGPFDLIFADPPYALGAERLIEMTDWTQWLKPSGALIWEWDPHQSPIKSFSDAVGCLVKAREKNYGDSVLTTFRRQ